MREILCELGRGSRQMLRKEGRAVRGLYFSLVPEGRFPPHVACHAAPLHTTTNVPVPSRSILLADIH
jgi:hypothetical protein